MSQNEAFIPLFPTHQSWQKDGPTVSFTEIGNWLACPFKHMLAHIKRIETFEKNVHTSFGTVAHQMTESIIMSRHVEESKRSEIMPIEFATLKLEEQWIKDRLGNIRASPADEPVNWVAVLEQASREIEPFLSETFGDDWQGVDAEHRLLEPLANFPPKFKGSIDGILVTKGKGGKDTYWIIDWKFTTFWSREKRSDFDTLLQLILYKQFWSLKTGIPLDQIKCAFILGHKKAKSGQMFELVPVPSNPAMLERGNKTIKNMLTSVQRGIFLKKRTGCKYCPYAGTAHCP